MLDFAIDTLRGCVITIQSGSPSRFARIEIFDENRLANPRPLRRSSAIVSCCLLPQKEALLRNLLSSIEEEAAEREYDRTPHHENRNQRHTGF
jgi:hypothetical protein